MSTHDDFIISLNFYLDHMIKIGFPELVKVKDNLKTKSQGLKFVENWHKQTSPVKERIFGSDYTLVDKESVCFECLEQIGVVRAFETIDRLDSAIQEARRARVWSFVCDFTRKSIQCCGLINDPFGSLFPEPPVGTGPMLSKDGDGDGDGDVDVDVDGEDFQKAFSLMSKIIPPELLSNLNNVVGKYGPDNPPNIQDIVQDVFSTFKPEHLSEMLKNINR
jgi:hypothetical protein